MTQVLENVATWDVDDEFQLPRLDDVVDSAAVLRSSLELTSSYFDTSDHDLEAHGVLLRRHTADADAGWHLSLPGEDAIEVSDSSDAPPSQLVALLTGVRLGKPLVEVATIRTTRDRYRVTSAASGVSFELDDDRVRASTGHDKLFAWREIDVELGTGVDTTPKKLARRLAKAGARPGRYPSKLLRLNRKRAATKRRKPTPAVAALTDYMGEQIDQIFAGDVGLRRGRDPIHDTRVAIRRLRSTVRVFAKVLDPYAVGDIDDELKWYAGLLGEVRDCHVQQNRLLGALGELAPELVLGPVSARITNELRAIELPARQVVAEAMETERYLTLLTRLAQWRTNPPIARQLSTSDLSKRAGNAYSKADRRLAEALESDEDDLLHRARKAAKRARYAAELQKPVDRKAKKTVKRFKRIQTVLGDHQDGVVATATLRRLGIAAGTTDGENGFTFGLLYQREQQDLQRARKAALTLLSANS